MKITPWMKIIALSCISILYACSIKQTGKSVKLNEDKENQSVKDSSDKISLRGYGTVSFMFRTADAGGVLEVVCENDAKAKLLQSKYLSDIQLLPRTKQVTVAEKISAVEAEDQGFLAALRFGNKVQLLASSTRQGLEKLIVECTGKLGNEFSSSSEVEVPMWLDRWDKFGFRFYYRPWERPKGKDLTTYDILREFDYAEKTGKNGFVFWAGEEALDTAEGLTNDNEWNWALQAATGKNEPFGLNLGMGSSGSGWLYNRYRDQVSQKAPQFCGNFHGIADPQIGANGFISWNSTTAKDAELGMLQDIVREKAKLPNLTTILEAHGELRHGAYDLLMEYGPLADTTYRKYLKDKYKTLDALSQSWKVKVYSWDGVRVPELAEFLGWGKQAIDLAGEWRVGYEKYADGKNYTSNELWSRMENSIVKTEGAPVEWFSEKFDDSSWPTVVAPGNDRTMFLYRRPAVYRRTINVPSEWLSKNPRVWLYVWDLNSGALNIVKAAVNGKNVGESELVHAKPHWMALEVTGFLRAGANQISLRLPKGYLAYRVYLSPDEPKQYPNLGEGCNAQWADFTGWVSWSRLASLRRGMEMIRQVEPGRQIDLMAPGAYADGVKTIALQYGGNFKNTGYMGAFWADDLPAIMRGAGFPFSLEPGGPAENLHDFQKMMGLYATEGIQAIDYYIHIGNIMWNPEIRKEFEDTLPMIKLIGKYHAPTAELAALYSTCGAELTGYPWGQDCNTNLGSGYWTWNVRAPLMLSFESDALTESSFENGDASRYKAIIDTNTSIMDEKTVSHIEKYVNAGGTFITFVQTGRHTSVKKDAWPISCLTGYEVTRIDKLDQDGNPSETRTMVPAPDQNVISGDWSKHRANGLSLKKVSEEAQDIMLWEDGSTAVGYRQLGKGFIVQIGCKFNGRSMFDRIEGEPNSEMKDTLELFKQILRWRGIAPIEVKMSHQDYNALIRHYVSNNGLYDVWTVWNRNDKQSVKGELSLHLSSTSNWAWDVNAKSAVQIKAGKIPVNLNPLKYSVFLTPRNQIASAPQEWFRLQCNWWRGTEQPAPKQLPPAPHKLSVDLCKGWAFKPVKDGEDPLALTKSDLDDSSWEKIRLGIWSSSYPDVKHAVLRKVFTVPEEWTDGSPTLWIKGWNHIDFVDKGRVWLDGSLVSDWSSDRILCDSNPDKVLKPGTAHVIAIEIEGKGCLVGAKANAYLWYWPKPAQTIDLAGAWSPSDDVLRYKDTVNLPGQCKALTLRRNIKIPADLTGKNIVVDIEAEGPVTGVIINGHFIRRLHHNIEQHFQLNVTPYVLYGQDNEIEVVIRSQDGDFVPLQVDIKNISLSAYAPEVYP